MGGGQNHRFDLSDGILVKDNHWQALRAQGVDIAEAVRRLRERTPGMKIEVEVTSAAEAEEALAAGVDILLLDNMSLEETRRVVRWPGGRVDRGVGG
jgi:nicotinate-nucleotide pyrophosphorylase (carboxylating)